MIKKISTFFFITVYYLFFSALPALAHVVVKPNQAGIASFQEFTISVPSEKDNPTVGVKLLIPNGLSDVTPNVKPGWTITEKKAGNGDNAKVTEIEWTGGLIPPGQRDNFFFSARVPAKATTLAWKAYQAYQDGSIVAWDHDPKLSKGDDALPPYSITQVINDLRKTDTSITEKNNVFPMELSIIALALSAVSIGLTLRKK